MKIYQWMCLWMLVLCLILPGSALAEEGRISVTGEYDTVLSPQYATLHLAVRQVAKEMRQSHDGMMENLARLTSELKSLGIADEDMIKSLIRQGTEYVWKDNRRTPTGYFSECTLEIKVRKLTDLPLVYDKMAGFNALEIRATTYDRDDMEKQQRRALEKALHRAREKAERMAGTLKAVLGDPLEIREAGAPAVYPRPEAMMMARDASAGRAKAVAGGQFGQVKVHGAVSVVFELETADK